MKQVRWGMIGVGDVTEMKSGPAFYKTMNSSLLAVTSRTWERAKDYAERHGVPRVYKTVDELLTDKEIDIVYVATPPSTHRSYAIRAMEAGKHVYVEKPMALTAAEAEEMNRIATASNRRLYVAFYRRALPYFVQVKKLLDEQVLGTILTVSVRLTRPPLPSDLDPALHTWRIDKRVGGDGYFVDMAPHTLDILDYVLGPIQGACGFSTNRAGHYEVADCVTACWQHTSGVLGNGMWSFSNGEQQAHDAVRIIGTAGELIFSTFDFSPIRLITKENTEEYKMKRPMHIQQALIETIVDELTEKGVCPSTGESAARTAMVLDRILQKG
ncbi:Gfo/Idh/MocA family protein [Sphingobacterium suaedae]|uniref:Gfo/Idh/MocA family protein n=1 Tax=Sphingobacterium suaedae TaxID=1686402 RepID=A0ABW5KFK4_9SPHI